MAPTIEIQGSVAEGYEPVRKVFEQHFHDHIEDNAQVCVYVDGVKVVDLWGTVGANQEYDGDSLQLIFSSTKSLTAIAAACLVDKGLMNYDDKVSKHWPEFAKNGKEDVKIEDVLRHEAGMSWLNHTFAKDDLLPENIKKNSVGKIIEEEPLRFPPESAGTVREYHGFTRGFIINEIFRRVDPRGRTVGEFLREEISGPLQADAFIGATDEDIKRCQKLRLPGTASTLFQSLVPKKLGRKLEVDFMTFFSTSMLIIRHSKKEGGVEAPPPLEGFRPKNLLSIVGVLDSNKKMEIPSANGFCSARGLAKIAACMVNRGELDGVRILSEDTCAKMQDKYIVRKDAALGLITTEFSQGGVNLFQMRPGEENNVLSKSFNWGREGYVGWAGFGGSVCQWHPELKIGFAYTPTRLSWYDMAARRAKDLQTAVVDCVKSIKKKDSSS